MADRDVRGLPLADRPRETLMRQGARSLSDAELVAVLMGTGAAGAGVLTVGREVARLLHRRGVQIQADQLRQVPGVGMAKACVLLAAVELASRLLKVRGPRIRSAADVVQIANGIRHRSQEHFVVLTADGASNLLRKQTIFVGTLDRSLVHPREVLARAITDHAASIFLVHNHPSGNERPSDEDVRVTQRLIEAGRIIGIEVRDHVIVTRDGYFSFQEQALI